MSSQTVMYCTHSQVKTFVVFSCSNNMYRYSNCCVHAYRCHGAYLLLQVLWYFSLGAKRFDILEKLRTFHLDSTMEKRQISTAEREGREKQRGWEGEDKVVDYRERDCRTGSKGKMSEKARTTDIKWVKRHVQYETGGKMCIVVEEEMMTTTGGNKRQIGQRGGRGGGLIKGTLREESGLRGNGSGYPTLDITSVSSHSRILLMICSGHSTL